jgi:hypothetical protein
LRPPTTPSSTDEAGNVEGEKTSSIQFDVAPKDTTAPMTIAQPVTLKRGKTARLKFIVVDPPYSCGKADVRIEIRKGLVTSRQLDVPGVATNKQCVCRLKVTLRKGRYNYRVLATDAAGNVATDIAVARLTVK